VNFLGRLIGELGPSLLVFLLGYFLPARHKLLERLGLGVIGVLGLALVRGLWPGGAEASADEWPHLLNLIVFVPLLGAALLLFLPRQSSSVLKGFTLGVLLFDFAVSLWLLRTPMTPGWHHQFIAPWLPSFGIRYHVAIDGISLWLVLLTTLTTPIAAFAAFGSIQHRIKDLCFAILLLHAGMLGAFVALDLFLFYVFWELMLVPMIVLIGVWGGVERIKAAYKFFLYTMAGSVLMLAAILYMVFEHKRVAGYLTFDYLALSHLGLPPTAAYACFIAFGLAFAIKVPMFPLHTWLPDAHVQAPTGGSVILAAVLLKLGAYGYLRFCMGMFPGPAWQSGVTLAGVAVVGGILYGALVAWQQDDVKRLVAYSSVSHMGFVMLGLFAASQASVEGALLQMVSHGVSTGALFLLVGVIYDRRHTRMLDEFGGLAKVMPVYATIFVVVALSSIGVPGTNGFVGEFLVIAGTFASVSLGSFASTQAILASLGVILAAVYMLKVVQRMFFGPNANPLNQDLADLNVRETLVLSPLVVLIFAIGFFPQVFLGKVSDSVASVIEHYRDGRITYLNRPPESRAVVMIPRRGGPLEVGYPEPPKPTTAPKSEPTGSQPVVVAPVQAGDNQR